MIKKSILLESSVERLLAKRRLDNSVELTKLRKLIDDKAFEAVHFEDTPLDLLTFDYHSLNKDRNWWWQLHALPFLVWSTNSSELITSRDSQQIHSFAYMGLTHWFKQVEKVDSPLAWHDHATAFRLRNVIDWIACLKKNNLIEIIDHDYIADLIETHIKWLLDSKNYSKHTNHGFDQSLILYRTLLVIDGNLPEHSLELAKLRLKDEVSVAFTKEGVHVENSPGYQKFMLQRLKQLNGLASFGDSEVTELSKSMIEKSTQFLEAITMPNGKLPIVGDTLGDVDGVMGAENYDGLKVFDYSASGYIILKGQILENLNFYMMFKNSHLSSYHRHDDDLSFVLTIDDHEVFIDGGLGSHDERDDKRVFLRSFNAHNLPVLLDRKCERQPKLLTKNPVTNYQNEKIKAVNYMTGFEISRSIKFDRLLNNGCIKISDKFMADGLKLINFHIGNFKTKILNNRVTIYVNDRLKVNVTFYNIKDGNISVLKSFYSREYKKYIESKVIKVTTKSDSVETEINFEK